MIRIVRLSHTYYGLDIGNVESEEAIAKEFINFKEFINSGDPVLLLNNISDFQYFMPGMDESDITMVEREDE